MPSKLFEPIALRGLTLPNRIVVSPICQYSAVEGVAQPWHRLHLGTLAQSGAGLLILEASAVEAIGRISHSCLGLYDEAQEAALTSLRAELRALSDMPIGIQLGHAGRKGSCRASWVEGGRNIAPDQGGWVTVAPSALPFDKGWSTPAALDEAGLERIREAFAATARRAVRCGFDLVEIHAAHSYLLSSFISPLSNLREDRYGGSLENRLRFPLEVISATRAALPTAIPLGVRINGSDWHERGTTLDEAVVYARRMKELGVDYVTMSGGYVGPGAVLPRHEPSYMVDFAERVRREAGIPTMAVGMILTALQAEAIIASGRADMVALARAFMDDPRWAWHAAAALGVEVARPPQYRRVSPKTWPGYAVVHR